jgi:hypothetical protein
MGRAGWSDLNLQGGPAWSRALSVYTIWTRLRYDAAMKLSRSLRKLGSQIEDSVDGARRDGGHFLRNVGWVSAGITALALGVVVGREVRQRYKFNRRTPYDFYANSGDQAQDVEFGVGI